MPTVLVSGANRGLGLEFVRQYANDGWRVHAASREPETADTIAGDVVGHLLDVTNPKQISDLSRHLASEPLEVLINNAGIWIPEIESLESFNTSAWDRYMHANALGPLLLSQAFADLLSPQGAKLINISSRSASLTLPTTLDLGTAPAKLALNAITKSLSVDWRSRKITVIAITPGWVRTDMGGEAANLSVEESVSGMKEIISKLTIEHSGRFYAYDGQEIPW